MVVCMTTIIKRKWDMVFLCLWEYTRFEDTDSKVCWVDWSVPLVPLLTSGGKALLREGAKTGLQLAGDVLSGQSFKSAAKQRAQEAGKRLFQQAVGHVVRGGATPAPPGEPARKRIKSTVPKKRLQKGQRQGARTKRTTSRFQDIVG